MSVFCFVDDETCGKDILGGVERENGSHEWKELGGCVKSGGQVADPPDADRVGSWKVLAGRGFKGTEVVMGREKRTNATEEE